MRRREFIDALTSINKYANAGHGKRGTNDGRTLSAPRFSKGNR